MNLLNFAKKFKHLLLTQYPKLITLWLTKNLPHVFESAYLCSPYNRVMVPTCDWTLKPEFQLSRLQFEEYRMGSDFYRLFCDLISRH